MAGIINTVAWILCFIVGFLLFGDFIRTEIYFAKEKKKQAAQKGVTEHESDE